MCLAVLALQFLPHTPVLISANRDEFHARPAQAIQQWPGYPAIYGGRDLRAGGTWMAVSEQGRYAIITNYRDPKHVIAEAPSRGELVEQYLRNNISPQTYLTELYSSRDQYNGFNLIVGDSHGAYYLSNRGGLPRQLSPGVYGLSNHFLDTPWPKLIRVKSGFEKILRSTLPLDIEAHYANMNDRTKANDFNLPNTGISLDRERLLSSPFIVSPDYGTRASTVMALHTNGQGALHERSYNEHGVAVGNSHLTFAWHR